MRAGIQSCLKGLVNFICRILGHQDGLESTDKRTFENDIVETIITMPAQDSEIEREKNFELRILCPDK